MKQPKVLIIRDGWGINPKGRTGAKEQGDATLLAKTPYHDYLYQHYPMAQISCSGLDAGLPAGQMGNSEVGHLNLGAGRIVYQDLTRINRAIETNELSQLPALQEIFSYVKTKNKALHFLGLLSDGGVHSHQDHLYVLLQAAKAAGLSEVYLHLFLDGRDTSPLNGIKYLQNLMEVIQRNNIGSLATVIGRYYAMDRDNRWSALKKLTN